MGLPCTGVIQQLKAKISRMTPLEKIMHLMPENNGIALYGRHSAIEDKN